MAVNFPIVCGARFEAVHSTRKMNVLTIGREKISLNSCTEMQKLKKKSNNNSCTQSKFRCVNVFTCVVYKFRYMTKARKL